MVIERHYPYDTPKSVSESSMSKFGLTCVKAKASDKSGQVNKLEISAATVKLCGTFADRLFTSFHSS